MVKGTCFIRCLSCIPYAESKLHCRSALYSCWCNSSGIRSITVKSTTIAIVGAIVAGALAQLLMKSGLSLVTLNNVDSFLRSLATNPGPIMLILAGLTAYVASMVVWVSTLKRHKLNKAYPLLSLGYVVVYLLAFFWPGIQEPFTVHKSFGISLIVFGVWFSQRSPSLDET